MLSKTKLIILAILLQLMLRLTAVRVDGYSAFEYVHNSLIHMSLADQQATRVVLTDSNNFTHQLERNINCTYVWTSSFNCTKYNILPSYKNLVLKNDGKLAGVISGDRIALLTLSNGKISNNFTHVFSTAMSPIRSSDDLSIVYTELSIGATIRIHNNTGSGLTLLQEITRPVGGLYGNILTPNNIYFTYTSNTTPNILYIYKKNTKGLFEIHQQIKHPTLILYAKVMSNYNMTRLGFATSERICIFKKNSTTDLLQFSQQILYLGASIRNWYILETKIVVGLFYWNQTVIKILVEDSNGAYVESETVLFREPYVRFFVAGETLFMQTNHSVFVYQKCLLNCLECTPNKTCLACFSGYVVETGKCILPVPVNPPPVSPSLINTTNSSTINNTVDPINNTADPPPSQPPVAPINTVDPPTVAPINNTTDPPPSQPPVSPINNTADSPSTSNTTTNPPQSPIDSTTNPIPTPTQNNETTSPSNKTESNTKSSNETNNAIIPPIVASSQPEPCLKKDEAGICQIYCHYKCSSCTESYDRCTKCSQFYSQNQEGDCIVSKSITATAVGSSAILVISLNHMRSIFLFNSLELYEYQNITFNGVIKTVFSTVREVNRKAWTIFDAGPLRDWTQRSFIPNMEQFTNKKFLLVERTSSIFIENTKNFFLFYCSLICILFFVLNRLFYFLFQYSISLKFRIYSFRLYLLQLLFLGNVQMIGFLAFRNLILLFSFEFWFKTVQGMFVLFFGFLLIGLISLFYLYEYFYKSFVKYFLANLYVSNKSATFCLIRYIIKPMVLCAIHALCFSSPHLQYILLIFTEILSFCMLAFFQISYHVFKSKMLFCIDLFFDLAMIILNFMLMLKFVIFSSEKEIALIFEEGLQICAFLIISLISSFVIYSFILVIFNPAFNKVSKIKQIRRKPIRLRTSAPKKVVIRKTIANPKLKARRLIPINDIKKKFMNKKTLKYERSITSSLALK